MLADVLLRSVAGTTALLAGDRRECGHEYVRVGTGIDYLRGSSA